MDKAVVARLIQHAKGLGLDPGMVLSWRLNFDSDPYAGKRVQRPKGLLSMTDAIGKYDLTPAYLSKLRREHGLPATTKSNLVLVDEAALTEWMKRFPPSNALPGRPRKSPAPSPGH